MGNYQTHQVYHVECVNRAIGELTGPKLEFTILYTSLNEKCTESDKCNNQTPSQPAASGLST